MGVTLHFQSTGTVPGNGEPVAMIGPSLTIGRGAENDLCLPDPGKVISKRHCAIEERGGDIVVVDLSTNGTFLNYGKMPVGEVPAPLNDGDILTLGPYELLVEIVSQRRAEQPILPPEDDAENFDLPPRSGAEPLPLGDEGDDFLDELLGDTPLKGPAGVQRDVPGDDGLLPPLGPDDDDDLLSPPSESTPEGASQSDHGGSVNDSFRPTGPARGPSENVIPDDWEDDLLAPVPDDTARATGAGTSDDPFAASVAPPAFIPEDEPLDDRADETPPADDAPPEDTAPPPDEDALPDDTDVTPIERPRPARRAAPPDRPSSPSPRAPDPRAPTVVSGDAARAFLDALGADDLEVSDAELVETMARLGGVMHEMIKGLREILMTRADIKSEFRIQQTRIGAGGNNPLKFSISPEQAVEAMVKPRTKGYLEAGEATRQALDDIKAHEVAMMSAMEAALKGVLKQLSPEVLEGQMTQTGGLGSLLKGKKARYWEVYEEMYARISDQAENDFHEVFSKAFAKAYQAQLERLK